ncbi:MAG: lysine--tRNA ligase [Candidatus Woesearchaeota archaeon]
MTSNTHWATKAAENIIHKYPHKKIYTLAAGISPSGTVHIGNFRDLITAETVERELKKKGKKTRFIFSWDDYDRFRKIPKNIPSEFEKYLGLPLSKIPSPFKGKEKSYAEHFEKELEKSLTKLGINPKFIYQTQMYELGKYRKGIITAMKKRKIIAEILAEFRTQGFTKEEIENYYPLEIYCEKCKKDTTKITSFDEKNTIVEYTCSCGYQTKVNISKKDIGKLQWKVDWAMRWAYEDVCFEPGGQDHSSPQGSYQVSKRIAKKVFNIEPPIYQPYDFIGLSGLSSKMSGSTGINISPEEMLLIYEPELLRWLFLRVLPMKRFNFCFDSEIIRQYEEFDKEIKKYLEKKLSEEKEKALELSQSKTNFIKKNNIPFRLISSIGQLTQGNLKEIKRILKDLNTKYNKESIKRRLILSENWLTKYSPENKIMLLKEADKKYFKKLSKDEKKQIENFFLEIEKNWELEKLTNLTYKIPKKEGLSEIEIKKRQRLFFKNVYMLLIGKETGPRLATFMISIGKKKIKEMTKEIILKKE